jgi:putative ABC transport system permease protein
MSPLGFKEEDIRDVAETEGVASVQEGYTKDLFLTSKDGVTSVVRLYSYDKKYFKDGKGMNIPVVIEGRMPEKTGEIVVETGHNVPNDVKIGSEVVLSVSEDEEAKKFVKTDTFTVVGKIDSPMYINFERGQTNIGNGSIDFFAYISEDDFAMEKVSDLFLKTKESSGLTAYSNEYKEHLKPVKSVLEKLGTDAVAQETGDLRKKLEEGKREIEDNRTKAQKELDDAEKKLQDAENEIADGEKELDSNSTKYSKELKDRRAELEKGKAEIEKGRALYKENYEKWLKSYNEYIAAEKKLKDTKVALDENKAKIEQAEKELPEAKEKLEDAKAGLDMLSQSIEGLKAAEKDLTGNPLSSAEEYDELIDKIGMYSGDAAGIIANTAKYGDENLMAKVTAALGNIIAGMEAKHTAGKNEYYDGVARYEQGGRAISEYKNGLTAYEEGIAMLNASKPSLDNGKIELDRAKKEIETNEARIKDGEKALTKGKRDLDKSLEEGRQKLAKAKTDLIDGRKDYEEEKTDALKKIDDAEKEIKDSEKKLLQIPSGWFIYDRDGNPGYAGYGDDAKRIGAVAKVFPLFFFLVAALVCLTTMTRMVEEERIDIGTFKALGYSTLTISSKYLVYALLSSLLGALIGLSVGFWLFPSAIMNAYGIMYNIHVKMTPYHIDYAVISILLAVITTVSASLVATLQELRATPAVLIQPKAPKPGKRIILERITVFWNRLSFSHKITARNILRYKRRFFMTVIGISGCTALLVTGFGLKNSINDIMDKQFDEIFTYSGLVMLDTEKDASQRDLGRILGENAAVNSHIRMLSESGDALVGSSNRSYVVNLMVPEDKERFKEFVNLRDRKLRSKIELASDSAVITEKLSELLNVKAGDTFKYRDTDNVTYEIRVGAISENYMSHYIFLSPEYYDKLAFEAPPYNAGIFNLKNPGEINKDKFKEELMDNGGVLGVMLTEGIADTVGKTIQSLDYVVMILILSAGALAFVVLYNLTNINITERLREIATIKVLGFRDREVSAYVYRENIILTVVGTMLGLLLGVLLHKYVIDTMEIDAMMFGKNVHFISYIFSIALTLVFSILVNFSMYNKLKNINMVESLKSIE